MAAVVAAVAFAAAVVAAVVAAAFAAACLGADPEVGSAFAVECTDAAAWG